MKTRRGKISSYLITGGSGFIGSHIANRLLELNHHVTIVDNVTTGQLSNMPSGAQHIDIDLSDKQSLSFIPVYNYQAVLHLAAQTSGEISNENPQMDLNTNAIGTLNLLDWCAEHELNRFIYASSMAVYGLTDDKPINEDHPLKPYSFYGISKQTAENYVRHYAERGINSTILRMFNVYGPGQDLSNMRQGMVSIYLAYLSKKIPILVKGSLDRFRDYIFIEDVVDAWVKCINTETTHGNTYNLASGQKTLVRDLISQLLKSWGYDPSSYKIDQGEGTPRDQFGIYADIQAIKSDLQWEPQFSLEKGLFEMCDWAKNIPHQN